MIQTVQLNTANLGAACRDYYRMTDKTISAQLIADTELYGVAITGFPIMSSHPYFEEIKIEALRAKKIADKAKEIQTAIQRKYADDERRKENIDIIRAFGMNKKMEQEYIEVLVNATV